MQLWQIRTEQYEVFRKDARRAFVRKLADHLRRELPDRCGKLTDDDGLLLAMDALDRARSLSFLKEDDVTRFAEVFALFGPDFGVKPDHGLALRMLRSPSIIAGWPAGRGMIVATREIAR